MDTLSKVLRIVLAILMVVSFAITIWFYYVANGINSDLDANVKIDQFGSVLEYFVDWTYLLLIIAAGGTVVASVTQIATNPKGAIRSLASIAILGVLVGVAYSLASSDLMHLPNYDGAGNEPTTLKWAGTSLIAMYLLFGGAFLAIIYSEVSKIFK